MTDCDVNAVNRTLSATVKKQQADISALDKKLKIFHDAMKEARRRLICGHSLMALAAIEHALESADDN